MDRKPEEIVEKIYKKYSKTLEKLAINERKEREFMEYVETNADIGYGRMMQLISEHWKAYDPIGALMVGTCYGLEKNEYLKLSKEQADDLKALWSLASLIRHRQANTIQWGAAGLPNQFEFDEALRNTYNLLFIKN